MNPGKKNRVAEAQAHAAFCGQLGIPVFGEIGLPGTSESGDIVWLDSRTLLIGHGYRTNQAGIEQMRALLANRKMLRCSPRRCLMDRGPRLVCT